MLPLILHNDVIDDKGGDEALVESGLAAECGTIGRMICHGRKKNGTEWKL
jgi:hypothetical protein